MISSRKILVHMLGVISISSSMYAVLSDTQIKSHFNDASRGFMITTNLFDTKERTIYQNNFQEWNKALTELRQYVNKEGSKHIVGGTLLFTILDRVEKMSNDLMNTLKMAYATYFSQPQSQDTLLSIINQTGKAGEVKLMFDRVITNVKNDYAQLNKESFTFAGRKKSKTILLDVLDKIAALATKARADMQARAVVLMGQAR